MQNTCIEKPIRKPVRNGQEIFSHIKNVIAQNKKLLSETRKYLVLRFLSDILIQDICNNLRKCISQNKIIFKLELAFQECLTQVNTYPQKLGFKGVLTYFESTILICSFVV